MDLNVSDRTFDMDLEELRKAGLSSVAANNVCMLPQQLIALCGGLHAAWLFHPWGRPALHSLCQSLSSMAYDKDGSWLHFAGILNIPWKMLECINHDKSGRDKSEMSLMTYAQSSTSTLDEIMKALETVKRFDALATVEPSIKQLVETVKSNVGNQYLLRNADRKIKLHNAAMSEIDDTQSTSTITPKGYEKLQLFLPIALRNLQPLVNERKVTSQLFTKSNSRKEDESYQRTTPTTANVLPYRKIIFLTFTKDGEDAAYRIANILRHPKTDRPPLGVLILDENADKLQANPELLIPTLFKQADFVMPVITEGYLKAVKCQSNEEASPKDLFSSLDETYSHYIYDLMTKYYVTNQCRNDKFRCVVVGDDESKLKKLVYNPLFSNEPTLKAWVYESDVEKLAQRLVGCPTPSLH